MPSQNIQQLFASIEPIQVIRYLSRRGWTCRSGADRIDFESPVDAAGDTRRLALPAKSSHPRFRSLLPNIVFSVAVMDSKEAIDIANAIADEPLEAETYAAPQADSLTAALAIPLTTTAATPSSADSATTTLAAHPQATWWLEMVNDDPTQLLDILDRKTGTTVQLPPGEQMRLRGHLGSSCTLRLRASCELEYAGDKVPTLLLGMPAGVMPTNEPMWIARLSNFLKQSVASMIKSPPPHLPPAHHLVGDDQWIEQSVARFAFLLGPTEPFRNLALLKQATAILLVDCFSKLRGYVVEDKLNTELTKIARWLMALGSQAMVVQAPIKLLAVLQQDQQAAPDETCRWLGRAFKDATNP